MTHRRFNLLVILFAVSVFAFASFVHAETIQATGSGQYMWTTQYSTTPKPLANAISSSCPPGGDVYGNGFWSYTGNAVSLVYTNGGLSFTASCETRYYNGTQFGSYRSLNGTRGAEILQCPSSQNWTLSGSTCTRPDCTAGQYRNSSGVCVSQPTCGTAQTFNSTTGQCDCSSVSGKSAMVGGAQAWGITGATSSSCTTGGVNYGGCHATCTSGVSAGGNAACTGCSFDGTTAPTGTTEATPIAKEQTQNPTTPQSCLASGQGYITNSSGVTTCVDSTSAPNSQPVTSSNKTTSTTTNKDASGNTTGTSSTSQTTESTCSGGNCTTTTTTMNPDGTKTEQTKTNDSAKFCQENPTSPMCKSECEEFPDRPQCMDLGTISDNIELQTKELGVNAISVVSFGGGGSCPAPIQLPHGAQFSFENICDGLGMLRPLLLALAWLSAGLIVVGAAREN